MPRHVLTDKGAAFNVIKVMMLDVYGELPPEIVQTAEGPISVKTFQAGSSVHNTPIERSWRDANDVTRKYVDICDALAAEGLLSNGRKIDDVDVWIFQKVYLPAIKVDLKMHYDRMNAATKDRRTKYKDAPKGIPDVNYELLHSRGRVIDKTQAESLRLLTTAHCKCALSPNAQWPVRSDWEVDPLEGNAAHCAQRDRLFSVWQVLPLREQYINLRLLTRALLS